MSAEDLRPATLYRKGPRRGVVALVAAAILGAALLLYWQVTADSIDCPTASASSTSSCPTPPTRADPTRTTFIPPSRELNPGSETLLAEVHAVAIGLQTVAHDWSHVDPIHIGILLPHIGILDHGRSGDLPDEVSMRVDPLTGVVLGVTVEDDLACTWLRDDGSGPEVALSDESTDCSADAAPKNGWVRITNN